MVTAAVGGQWAAGSFLPEDLELIGCTYCHSLHLLYSCPLGFEPLAPMHTRLAFTMDKRPSDDAAAVLRAQSLLALAALLSRQIEVI